MAKLEKIGVQLFTIRDYMNTEEDIKKSFERIKSLGYDTVQTMGCNIPYNIFGQLAKNAGLEIIGTHDAFDIMFGDEPKAMMLHDWLGTKTMGVQGFWFENMAGYKNFVLQVNKICKTIGPEGYKFTYHNHRFDFIDIDGEKPFDYLVENFEKDNVFFCLDTYGITWAGEDCVEWLKKLSGRVEILHLHDIQMENGKPKYTEVGNGMIDWDKTIDAALDAGTKHFIVEQDALWKDNNPFLSLEISSNYLHKHFM